MRWHLGCGRAGSALLMSGPDVVPGVCTVGSRVGRAWDVSSGPGLMEGEENEKRKCLSLYLSLSQSQSLSLSQSQSLSLSL